MHHRATRTLPTLRIECPTPEHPLSQRPSRSSSAMNATGKGTEKKGTTRPRADDGGADPDARLAKKARSPRVLPDGAALEPSRTYNSVFLPTQMAASARAVGVGEILGVGKMHGKPIPSREGQVFASLRLVYLEEEHRGAAVPTSFPWMGEPGEAPRTLADAFKVHILAWDTRFLEPFEGSLARAPASSTDNGKDAGQAGSNAVGPATVGGADPEHASVGGKEPVVSSVRATRATSGSQVAVAASAVAAGAGVGAPGTPRSGTAVTTEVHAADTTGSGLPQATGRTASTGGSTQPTGLSQMSRCVLFWPGDAHEAAGVATAVYLQTGASKADGAVDLARVRVKSIRNGHPRAESPLPKGANVSGDEAVCTMHDCVEKVLAWPVALLCPFTSVDNMYRPGVEGESVADTGESAAARSPGGGTGTREKGVASARGDEVGSNDEEVCEAEEGSPRAAVPRESASPAPVAGIGVDGEDSPRGSSGTREKAVPSVRGDNVGSNDEEGRGAEQESPRATPPSRPASPAGVAAVGVDGEDSRRDDHEVGVLSGNAGRVDGATRRGPAVAPAVAAVGPAAAMVSGGPGDKLSELFKSPEYKRKRVYCGIGQMQLAEYALRKVDMGDELGLMDKLRGGFDESISHLHVTLAEASDVSVEDCVIEKDGETWLHPNAVVIVLDGQHRLLFMGRLQELKQVAPGFFNKVCCMLWLRVDGSYMSAGEVLDIMGACANGNETKPYSFSDNAFAVRSHAYIFRGTAPRVGGGDEVRRFTDILHRSPVTRAQSRSSCATYARLGLFLADHEEAFSMLERAMRECADITLTHVSDEKVYSRGIIGFEACLDAVRALLRHRKAQKQTKYGPFKNWASQFYALVIHGLDAVGKYGGAQVPQATLSDRLDIDVSASVRRRTVRESLQASLLEFLPTKKFASQYEKEVRSIVARMARNLPTGDSDVEVVPVDRPSKAPSRSRRSTGTARSAMQRELQSLGGGSRGATSAAADSSRTRSRPKRGHFSNMGVDTGAPQRVSARRRAPKRATSHAASGSDEGSDEEYASDAGSAGAAAAGAGEGGAERSDKPAEPATAEVDKLFYEVPDLPEDFRGVTVVEDDEAPSAADLHCLSVPWTMVDEPGRCKANKAYLKALGLPEKHRANLLVSTSDIFAEARAVDAHAAFNVMCSMDLKTIAGRLRGEAAPRAITTAIGGFPEALIARRAVEDSAIGAAFFASQRRQLDHVGFCLFEGVLSDAMFPWLLPGDNPAPPHVKQLMDYALGSFSKYKADYDRLVSEAKEKLAQEQAAAREKVRLDRLARRREQARARKGKARDPPTGDESDRSGEQSEDDGQSGSSEEVRKNLADDPKAAVNNWPHPDGSDEWGSITNINPQVDYHRRIEMKTRYQSRRAFMFDRPEHVPELAHLPRCKALVDVRCSLLVKKLGLMEGNHPYEAAAIGSRLLATPIGCEPQRLHCDYETAPMYESPFTPPRLPGCFVIFTGEHDDWVRLVPRSHFAMNNKDSQGLDLTEDGIGELYQIRIENIPPFSVIVIRADVVHAGDGLPESDNDDKWYARIRGHMMYLPKGMAMPDKVYYVDHFFHPAMQEEKK